MPASDLRDARVNEMMAEYNRVVGPLELTIDRAHKLGSLIRQGHGIAQWKAVLKMLKQRSIKTGRVECLQFKFVASPTEFPENLALARMIWNKENSGHRTPQPKAVERRVDTGDGIVSTREIVTEPRDEQHVAGIAKKALEDFWGRYRRPA